MKKGSREGHLISNLGIRIIQIEQDNTTYWLEKHCSNNTQCCSHKFSGFPLLAQRTIARQIELQKEIGQGRFGEVIFQ